MSLSPVLVGPDPVCANASGAIAAQARAIILDFICAPFFQFSSFLIRVPAVVWMFKTNVILSEAKNLG
jgi:hypothetical protein